MYQPWSFYLAWLILLAGFLATAIVVVWLERRERKQDAEMMSAHWLAKKHRTDQWH